MAFSATANWSVSNCKSVDSVFVCPLCRCQFYTFIAFAKTKLSLHCLVIFYILAIGEIGSVAGTGHCRSIAAQLHTVHAKVLKIERVPLVAAGKICVV